MKQVSLYEAKTHLSKLVDEAAAGEEIIIAKNGKPMARLILSDAQAKREPRKLGLWNEQNKNLDWDKWERASKALDKEIEADFEASIAKPFQDFADDSAPSVKPRRRRIRDSSERRAASKAGKGRRMS